MPSKPAMSKVTPVAEYSAEDEEDRRLFEEMLAEASTFLASFDWCDGIKEEYVGIAVPGVMGEFLFRISPSEPDVDEWLWVIVGDIPPAYITTEDSPNPASALDAYIGAMEEWVAAVKEGHPTDDLIPVNVTPDQEHAEMLATRLEFLDENVLAEYKEDLSS